MKQIFTLSIAMILAFGVANGQNPMNGGFETWNTLSPGVEEPDGWATLNIFSALFGVPVTTEKSTDKHSGNYSMKLRSIEDSSEIVTGFAFTVFPVAKKPLRISGYYKYTRTNAADSAIVTLVATKWNNITMESDAIGAASLQLGPTNQWTPFTATVQYMNSDMPDSATIMLIPSIGDDNNDGFVADAWFDDMLVEDGGLGLASVMPVVGKAKLYPNPAQGQTTLEFFSHHEVSFKVKLIENSGKVHFINDMQTFGAGTNTLPLNLEGVSAGTHFLHISDGEKSQVLKITVL